MAHPWPSCDRTYPGRPLKANGFSLSKIFCHTVISRHGLCDPSRSDAQGKGNSSTNRITKKAFSRHLATVVTSEGSRKKNVGHIRHPCTMVAQGGEGGWEERQSTRHETRDARRDISTTPDVRQMRRRWQKDREKECHVCVGTFHASFQKPRQPTFPTSPLRHGLVRRGASSGPLFFQNFENGARRRIMKGAVMMSRSECQRALPPTARRARKGLRRKNGRRTDRYEVLRGREILDRHSSPMRVMGMVLNGPLIRHPAALSHSSKFVARRQCGS